MNFINLAMIHLLSIIHGVTNNYGLAIVLITVLIRAILWPLNTQQMRSMKKMQELQPKLKALQDKYKDNPAKMQEQMMKFYAEYKFNPLAGCLPLLIQMPIFIGLYGALSSPGFLAETVHESFLGINNLTHTLRTHAGDPLDGRFNVRTDDKFVTGSTVKITYTDGRTEEKEVRDIHKALRWAPNPLAPGKPTYAGEVIPGTPVIFNLDLRYLGLSRNYIERVKSVEALVVNNNSREIERADFQNVNGTLAARMNTVDGKNDNFNMDVLILIVLYGIMTLLYQKVMTPKKPANVDPNAAPDPNMAAMKFMPYMFVVMMFFIPLPAGVLIYLVVTTALMFIQTAWINFTEGKKGDSQPPSKQVIDIKANQ